MKSEFHLFLFVFHPEIHIPTVPIHPLFSPQMLPKSSADFKNFQSHFVQISRIDIILYFISTGQAGIGEMFLPPFSGFGNGNMAVTMSWEERNIIFPNITMGYDEAGFGGCVCVCVSATNLIKLKTVRLNSLTHQKGSVQKQAFKVEMIKAKIG